MAQVQDPRTGQWHPIEAYDSYPSGNVRLDDGTVVSHEMYQQQQSPSQPGGGDIDNPGFPGGGVEEGGGSGGDSSRQGNWNNGSPPNIPLQAGHGWEFNGTDWVQVAGRGMGYTAPTTGGGKPTGGSGGGGYGGGGGFQEWDPGEAPAFNAPRWQAPPEFKYARQFAAPNAGELMNDPSFQFRLDQGRKAMEQSAAGKGVLRTGGTLKDLVNYGQDFATNEYSNVYNRKFNEYKFDYDKEADIYSKNYGLSRDVFDRNYKASYDEYSPKLRGWEVKSNANWQKYMFDRNKEQQDIGNW